MRRGVYHQAFPSRMQLRHGPLEVRVISRVLHDLCRHVSQYLDNRERSWDRGGDIGDDALHRRLLGVLLFLIIYIAVAKINGLPFEVCLAKLVCLRLCNESI
jgi:hypothetical protein